MLAASLLQQASAQLPSVTGLLPAVLSSFTGRSVLQQASTWWHDRVQAAANQHAQHYSTESTKEPPSTPHTSFIEVREYTTKPDGFQQYLKLTAEYGDVRKELLPFLGMFTCDLGGVMHRLIHLYHYKSFDHRDEIRAAAVRDPRWQRYIVDSRKYLANQTSKVLLENEAVMEMMEINSAAQYTSPPRDCGTGVPHVVYEMRTYHLPPGFNSMEQLVDALDKCLPDKVPEYTPSEKGQLVLFGSAAVGPLNQVTELWRYHTAQSCINARGVEAAMPTLFHQVANSTGVTDYSYEWLHPTTFSQWQ